jgi:hypothetical protein
MMDERKRKSVLVVVNNFVHDSATGLWLACLFLAFYINRRWPGDLDYLSEVQEFLFITSLAALSVIGVTGIIRRKTYTAYLYGVDLEVKRRALLIIKHILFAVIAFGGTWFLYQWSR